MRGTAKKIKEEKEKDKILHRTNKEIYKNGKGVIECVEVRENR